MFQHLQNDHKFQHLCFQRTAPNFNQTANDQSFTSEIQAEKEYVQRLKIQRQKIQSLYSKYDILLKELKCKQIQIKDKDRTILSLETKCKSLAIASQQSNIFKQQNNSIKSQNHTLQKAISELEQSYNYLHGQLRTKEAVTQQKYEEMQLLNDELIGKVRSLNKKFLQKQQQFNQKCKEFTLKSEQSKLELKKEKQTHFHQLQSLKQLIFQRQEQNKLLRTDNTCLKDRIIELQTYINEMAFEYEEKIENAQKERKIQLRSLKSEMDNLRQNNLILQKKWNKTKQEYQLKELSLNELSMVLEKQQKQFNQILFRLKKQFNQQKTILKEQLVQCENVITKLQRKLLQGERKQRCLYGKIKKYEVCLDAKRNLRQVQKEQLDKINLLLSL